MHDVKTVYSIPLLLNKQKVDEIILSKLKIKSQNPKLSDWKRVVKASLKPEKEVNVAFVGKYTELQDSYKSINEALEHAGIKYKTKVNINFVLAETITKKNVAKVLSKTDAVLVPGGFGDRGIEGMIEACRYLISFSFSFLPSKIKSLFPPSFMSVPLPAILVAIVTAPTFPASAIILVCPPRPLGIPALGPLHLL